MSKKIKEFVDIRDMHYLRPVKEDGELRLEIEEDRNIPNDPCIRQESLFTARLVIGAAVYVPRAGYGERTAWELARESLHHMLHMELFSEIYPWVDDFLHDIADEAGIPWAVRNKIYNHIEKLQDIIRPEK